LRTTDEQLFEQKPPLSIRFGVNATPHRRQVISGKGSAILLLRA